MKKYIFLATLALAAGGIQRSTQGAPPAGSAVGSSAGTLPSAAVPATTAGTQTPGSLGSPVTPSGLGTPATPGSLGTPVTPGSPITPGSPGAPITPGSLGVPVTPGVGTLTTPLPGNAPVIPGQVNPILNVPGSLTPTGVGNVGSLGTTTGSSTGLVNTPTLGGTSVVPGANPTLGRSLLQSESDRDLTAALRSSLLNNSAGPGAVPNAGIGQAGSPGTGTISNRALQSVQIDSRGGSVTLKGTVPTEADKRAIESRIMLTPGVQSINNQLTISPDSSRTPSSSVATPRQ